MNDIISSNILTNVPAMLSTSGNVTKQWRLDMNILAHKISGVYQIVNITNGHRYIGSAIDIQRRWSSHVRLLCQNKSHSPYLQNAWNRYGKDCFEFSVIEQCDSFSVIEREQYYIDTLRPEYNMAGSAGSRLGVKHSQEARRKISEASKGRKRSPEAIKKTADALRGNNFFLGRTHTIAARVKIGLAQLGKIVTAETREKQSKARKGFEPRNRRVTDAEIIKFFDANPDAFGSDAARFFGVTKCTINQRRAKIKSKEGK